ncbi:MAG: Modification methylase DpnIIB [Verrucomicrobia subdivision 3 bacterium]|nr:Modification methylase DpnIIB [Limisphaerales bacterium]
MKTTTHAKKRAIATYDHKDKERANNPPVGLVTPGTDPDEGRKQTYSYDPHLDPQLQWAGKTEHTSFEVPIRSLHVHERIDPRTIIEAVRKRNGGNGNGQMRLFEKEREIPLRQAIEFYQHAHNWSNRLIAGDSLLVMNSLLQKENMAGKVQCVYMDPPYGIKYGSNFQPFTNKREVKDGKAEDLTAEPEMIKAFRDTWELGIHSYLTYMRDRLLLAKELLTESGSCFVQIGDENVHRVGMVMDDIFGAENRLATISYVTTGGSSTAHLPEVADYLLWYAKDKEKAKYRQLYEPLTRAEVVEFFSSYVMVELPDGSCRKITDEECFDPNKFLPKGARLYRRMRLASQGTSTTGRSDPYVWNNRTFHCPTNRQWGVSPDGMDRLAALNRLDAAEGSKAELAWKYYEDEVPGRRIHNVWAKQMSVTGKKYIVQTADSVLQRCILMTTGPGDLVFDPTCGSGVAAYTAEKWGRRWITCDTSRVATTLAKQRLMTATFDYYKLAYPDEGVGSGFEYKKVPYVSAATLAYDKPQSFTTLFDQPIKDNKRARVTGPFTVEAVPAPQVIPIGTLRPSEDPLPADNTVTRSGETLRQSEWRDELLKTGIRGKSGQRISFARIESLPCHYLHAEAETKPDDSGADKINEPDTAHRSRRAVISFGPEHAPLERRQVESALQEAATLKPKPEIILFAAFQFDPEAAKDIDETNWPGMTLLKVQMNADLQTDDLKKKSTGNESFWLVGQPDLEVDSEQWLVNSIKEVIVPYDIIKKLSGADSLAKINELDKDDLSLCIAIAQGREIWDAFAADEGSSVHPGEHSRGTGTSRDGGISAISGSGTGIPCRIGDLADLMQRFETLNRGEYQRCLKRLRGDKQIVDRARKIAASLTNHFPLATIHYSQVTIHGFDYFNTKTGELESGDEKQIAVWMLDTDYDKRCLYPSQVFFPGADGIGGWEKLARNLKAEIDQDLIGAYAGTLSLPFELGKNKRIAVKIVDNRGIESLKVMDISVDSKLVELE